MKNIIYVNYQKVIPPFIINEIKAVTTSVDNIFYVSRKLKKDNRKDAQFGKTIFIFSNCLNHFFCLLKLPFLFFGRKSLNNLKNARKHKKCNFRFIIKHIKYLYTESILLSLLKKIDIDFRNTTIVGCWFDVCSLASGTFSKIKNIPSIAFAHAFEINPKITKETGYLFDDLKFQYNDTVFFISENKRNDYFDYLAKEGLKFNVDKTSVRYLGTFCPNNLPEKSPEHIFTIVSCSSMVEVKRLHLIVDILSKCKNKIKWIHIGDGPTANFVKKYAFSKLQNSGVCFEFLGYLSQEQVLNFYQNNFVDLFINVSSSEGIPVSIMEAMSFSIPILATNVGGVCEIVDQNMGFLIDSSFCPDNVSKIIESYMDTDDSFKNKIRKESRKKWDNYFNIENNVIDFYK